MSQIKGRCKCGKLVGFFWMNFIKNLPLKSNELCNQFQGSSWLLWIMTIWIKLLFHSKKYSSALITFNDLSLANHYSIWGFCSGLTNGNNSYYFLWKYWLVVLHEVLIFTYKVMIIELQLVFCVCVISSFRHHSCSEKLWNEWSWISLHIEGNFWKHGV